MDKSRFAAWFGGSCWHTRQSSSSLGAVTASNNDNQQLLKDCVCLVTGASRGIGKGIALQLGKEGATVYVTGTSTSSSSSSSRSSGASSSSSSSSSSLKSSNIHTTTTTGLAIGGPGTIEETARAITELGGNGIAVYCNHRIDDDVKELMKRIDEEYGHLDILINNAFQLPQGAIENLNKKFWEQSIDLWDSIHTVGLRSHYVASSFAMPLLLKSRTQQRPKSSSLPRPLIAMISSFGGITYTFNLPYGVGKAGVDRLAKDMALELDDEDICVVSLYPGVVMTERTITSVENGDWDKYVGIPLDNAESPEFTGKAIVALACDPNNMEKTGTYQVVAELAEEYDFTDIDGTRPPSIRSLRFLIPSYGLTDTQRERVPSSLIPNWKLPFWIMAQGKPPKPPS